MEDIMNQKQLNEDGSPSDQFLINEEFIAMLDYYVATSLSGRLPKTAVFQHFYKERVRLYKAFDGAEGKRNWRPLLLEQLNDWPTRFPDSVSKRRSRLSGVASKAAQEEAPIPKEDL